MKLREWRISNGMTLKQVADLLGVGEGQNPSRRVQRIETGEAPIDVFMADKIVAATNCKVTIDDLHSTRRDYLNGHTPQTEAAE